MAENHKWTQHSQGRVPPHAVIAGDDSDGNIVYIGRTVFNNDMVPVKVIPKKRQAYVAFNQELQLTSYEMLSGHNYDWLPVEQGEMPPNAVKLGCNAQGEYLYVARSYHEGCLVVGVVQTLNGRPYILHNTLKIFDCKVLAQPMIWLDASATKMPENAIVAGHDADGDTVYFGRVFLDGVLLAANVVPDKGAAFAACGKVSNVQVLVGTGYQWVASSDGNVVPRSVEYGHTMDGETVYVGRSVYADSLTVGKIHSSHGCIYVPYDDEEFKVDFYELLVRT